MNKFIYILIICSLIYIIRNTNIINIIVLIILFGGIYSYYIIYEKNITLEDNIINSFKKFEKFKIYNSYTFNNTYNFIKLFLKKNHTIEDLENIRIKIINNLISYNINIPYKLKQYLYKYINILNKYLIKYIKNENSDYKGNYLRTNQFNNRFDYY